MNVRPVGSVFDWIKDNKEKIKNTVQDAGSIYQSGRDAFGNPTGVVQPVQTVSPQNNVAVWKAQQTPTSSGNTNNALIYIGIAAVLAIVLLKKK